MNPLILNSKLGIANKIQKEKFNLNSLKGNDKKIFKEELQF